MKNVKNLLSVAPGMRAVKVATAFLIGLVLIFTLENPFTGTDNANAFVRSRGCATVSDCIVRVSQIHEPAEEIGPYGAYGSVACVEGVITELINTYANYYQKRPDAIELSSVIAYFLHIHELRPGRVGTGGTYFNHGIGYAGAVNALSRQTKIPVAGWKDQYFAHPSLTTLEHTLSNRTPVIVTVASDIYGHFAHAIIVYKIQNGFVYVADPVNAGARSYTISQFLRFGMTGIDVVQPTTFPNVRG